MLKFDLQVESERKKAFEMLLKKIQSGEFKYSVNELKREFDGFELYLLRSKRIFLFFLNLLIVVIAIYLTNSIVLDIQKFSEIKYQRYTLFIAEVVLILNIYIGRALGKKFEQHVKNITF